MIPCPYPSVMIRFPSARKCRQALLNVSAVLASASMTFADIVKMSFFLVRREDMEALVEVRKELLDGVRPAITTVFVAGLVSRFNIVRGYLGFIVPLIGGVLAAYGVLDDPALELRFSTPVRATSWCQLMKSAAER